MSKRRPYSEIVKKTLAGSAPFYISGRSIERGWIRYVTSSSCYHPDKNNSDMVFGKISGKLFVRMESENNVQATVGSFTKNTHHFVSAESPTWYLPDASAAETIEVYLEGYEVESDEK